MRHRSFALFTAFVATAVLWLAAAPAVARQLKTPADWKWRLDTPGQVVDTDKRTAGQTFFVAMPPGWHVTTGPATLLYHPEYQTKNGANFAVEAEIFLFPGQGQEEYGIFVGGKGLEPAATPSYLMFAARRDGRGAILRRGGPPLVDWVANDAILPHPGNDDTVKNVLRVEAGATDLVFTANGKEIAKIPRASVNLDGYFGFRFGANVNVHASRLDLTLKLAPVPVKK
jgi:hypothetical protein